MKAIGDSECYLIVRVALLALLGLLLLGLLMYQVYSDRHCFCAGACLSNSAAEPWRG
jgi:hypothetical protein